MDKVVIDNEKWEELPELVELEAATYASFINFLHVGVGMYPTSIVRLRVIYMHPHFVFVLLPFSLC